MQRTAVNHASANDRRALSAICDDLQCLTKKQLRGRDVDTVRAAIQELKFLDRIRGDLECLGDELAKIEKEHDSDLAHFPDQVGKTDLASCTFALDAACRFLSLLVPCHNLTLLKDALYQLVAGGSPPAMFHPEDHPKGRRPDVPNLMAAKGILAGMMHVQQSTGMPRKVAALACTRFG
jgi:hypothetical protein